MPTNVPRVISGPGEPRREAQSPLQLMRRWAESHPSPHALPPKLPGLDPHPSFVCGLSTLRVCSDKKHPLSPAGGLSPISSLTLSHRHFHHSPALGALCRGGGECLAAGLAEGKGGGGSCSVLVAPGAARREGRAGEEEGRGAGWAPPGVKGL